MYMHIYIYIICIMYAGECKSMPIMSISQMTDKVALGDARSDEPVLSS